MTVYNSTASLKCFHAIIYMCIFSYCIVHVLVKNRIDTVVIPKQKEKELRNTSKQNGLTILFTAQQTYDSKISLQC